MQAPEVQRRIKYQTDTTDDYLPSQLKQKRGLDDLDVINEYTLSPLNSAFITETRENSSPQEAKRIIREQALAHLGEEEVNWYEAYVRAQNPQQFERFEDAYSGVSSQLRLAETVRGAKSLRNTTNLSDEDFKTLKQDMAAERVEAFETNARRSAETQRLSRENQGANRLQRQFPNMDLNTIYDIVGKAGDWAESQADNGDGTSDAAKFGKVFNAMIDKAILQNTPEPKE